MMRSLLSTWQMEDRIFLYVRSVGRLGFALTPTSGVGETGAVDHGAKVAVPDGETRQAPGMVPADLRSAVPL